MKCSWCNSEGEVIGDAKSFHGSKIMKCIKCHHEWQICGTKSTDGYADLVLELAKAKEEIARLESAFKVTTVDLVAAEKEIASLKEQLAWSLKNEEQHKKQLKKGE